MSNATLIPLFAYKAWANSELFALLANKTDKSVNLLCSVLHLLDQIHEHGNANGPVSS